MCENHTSEILRRQGQSLNKNENDPLEFCNSIANDEEEFLDKRNSTDYEGENISSYEVEQAFLEIPNITEAAAYAIPAKGGEGMEDEVMVALMKNDNTPIDYNDLLNQAKKNFRTLPKKYYERII